jgi:hypothetical protein
MRWDALLADLQAQWDAAMRSEDDAMIRELAEAEAAGTRFGDRLRARRDHELTVRLVDASDRRGRLVDVARDWLVLADGDRRSLVPVAAVVAAWPLGGTAPDPGPIERGLSLGHVLRALAAEGAAVVVRTVAGDHRGRLVRVGADHADLHTAAGVVTVPWSALCSVDSG